MFIPFRDGEMFAILSSPTGPSRDVVAIIANGRGDQATFHRNQLNARLASRLADHGFHVLRFDYPGTGDATGTSRGFALTINQSKEMLRVASELAGLGFERFVLVGYCVGGRSVLAAAETLQGVEGVILGSTPLMTARAERVKPRPTGEPISRSSVGFARRSPLRRLAARLRSRWRLLTTSLVGNRPDPKVRRGFQKLAAARIPTLMIYGEGDDYVQEAREMLGLFASRFPADGLTLHEASGVLHGFLSTESQDTFIDVAEQWMANLKTEIPQARASIR